MTARDLKWLEMRILLRFVSFSRHQRQKQELRQKIKVPGFSMSLASQDDSLALVRRAEETKRKGFRGFFRGFFVLNPMVFNGFQWISTTRSRFPKTFLLPETQDQALASSRFSEVARSKLAAVEDCWLRDAEKAAALNVGAPIFSF